MASTEPKASHGMLVMGEDTVYLSHLPMFMPPHHFQVLLEVTLNNESGDAQRVYAEDRRRTGTDVYTLNPEPFRISDLAGAGGGPWLTSFTGTLFRGHFERGGTELLAPVTVQVQNVVHFRQFEHHATRPGALTYLVFGKGGELFLSHLITAPPDFDHVIAVRNARSASGAVITDDVLRTGPRIEISGRADRPQDRLQESDQVTGSIFVNGSAGLDLRLAMGQEFYLEEGELASGGHSH
ncbi:hypothetical protein [Kitasatospora sp. NPDC051914]|uniref:hypothetical protein n=1 Tax=Kitasatospora sp. NPDC051914 TaxID=3154945 RepID=UPI00341E1807